MRELIPLCHPLPVESVEVDFDVPELEPEGDEPVEAPHQGHRPHHRQDRRGDGSGATAVSVAALTIYDMCKAIDKTMTIEGIRVIRKTGGKSDFQIPRS